MAFTSPKTWASGYVVLASDLNTYIRDNQNMTAPAVMSAQGDIIIASGANTPIRLAKSTTSTQYLANTGTSNAPAWNEVALDTGVSATLPVGNGGTGATSLTANGILVGNSTSAVAVTATMATKGHLMAGDGSGVPSMLAVGTNDYVLTADSGEGTGIKWSAAAGGGPDQANAAEIIAASNVDKYIPPDLLFNSPTNSKAWGACNATLSAITSSHNVASLTDYGGGDAVWNFTVAYNAADYAWAGGVLAYSNTLVWANQAYTFTAGALRMITVVEDGAQNDKVQSFISFGVQ